MRLTNNQQAFLALLQAGLWEQDVQLIPYGKIDYKDVCQLAHEQSVVGIISAGIEHVVDTKVPKEEILTLVGSTIQIEQRNLAMNDFINKLMKNMHNADIHALLVKGQGIAQCYERPLWRTSGDIDLLLDAENYEKAKKLLLPLADRIETEYTFFKHIGMMLSGWEVELHGTFHSRLSRLIDDELDSMQEQIFKQRMVRVWHNKDTDVYLPAPCYDAIFIFTHILHHFFFEGIGLRQICDWCRLLWKFRSEINAVTLEKQLRKMGIMTEWKAFAAYAVDYLGMPVEAMPLYDPSNKWKKKASRIGTFVLKVGNFGHNRMKAPNGEQSYFVRKFFSFWSHAGYLLRHIVIFPKDSIFFFAQVFRSGMYAVIRKE